MTDPLFRCPVCGKRPRIIRDIHGWMTYRSHAIAPWEQNRSTAVRKWNKVVAYDVALKLTAELKRITE